MVWKSRLWWTSPLKLGGWRICQFQTLLIVAASKCSKILCALKLAVQSGHERLCALENSQELEVQHKTKDKKEADAEALTAGSHVKHMLAIGN